ncbi:LutC/YkgG family protein [Deinococcus hopiensis]|uniref:L-lactate dehydrogenase complex protein LldG n=1 Tax=Deinococcus hopiensis KR-140 TaxID=695939 RepID=A0A1W1UST8_9DEIO|nr:lactate utilization protein C [Deinococcus hopiensis]SMB84100.1 L-lactate dehydrogenase complex protein LldG [Deinococcus hopiensis KR-140]
MTAEARLEILTRTNRAAGRAQDRFERVPVRPSVRDQWDIAEQFAEYAAEYRANVLRTTRAQLQQAIGDLLRGRGRVAVPQDLPAEWLPGGLAVIRDEPGVTDLRAVHSVVTGAAAAIAETGTVVLDHGAGQGRRALTLVPDHHICVVFERQVMDSVPEAAMHLRGSALRGQPMTWISGPSATSDIELSRVEGVHGPRVLDIILVREA